MSDNQLCASARVQIPVMEHARSTKVIQGGGSGEGFQDLSQFHLEGDEYRTRIRDTIFRHVERSIFKEDLFDSADNNDSEIWKSQLKTQLEVFVPCQEFTENKEETDNALVEASRSDAASPGISEDIGSHNVRNQVNGDRRRTVLQCFASVPMRQEIPRLPKTAKDLVDMWLEGCQKKGFRPVNVYSTAKSRKLIIKRYSNHSWISSGQKRAFQRHKRLVQSIATLNDEIDNLECRDYRKWNKAIVAFEEKWKSNGKVQCLSYIEKKI